MGMLPQAHNKNVQTTTHQAARIRSAAVVKPTTLQAACALCGPTVMSGPSTGQNLLQNIKHQYSMQKSRHRDSRQPSSFQNSMLVGPQCMVCEQRVDAGLRPIHALVNRPVLRGLEHTTGKQGPKRQAKALNQWPMRGLIGPVLERTTQQALIHLCHNAYKSHEDAQLSEVGDISTAGQRSVCN